jgi:plastocyanin
MRLRGFFVVIACASLVLVPGAATAPSQAVPLFGTVGPGFTITLADASNRLVTQLDPGTYEIEVEDRSDFHSFHLRGPGVDEATDVTFTGTVTWTVTLRDGRYTYACDPHPTLAGSFTVGSPQTPAPPSGAAPITAKTRVVLTAGPSQRITLRTAAGKVVRTMRVGTYTMTVRDRSRFHNAHVRAPGYNRATTLAFVGTERWRVRLAKVGTLRFLCDPHASAGMRGSAKIVR